jgi:DNA-binding response OmpR family regulator
MLVTNEDKKKNRIMIVDDDPDICMTLSEVFKDNGFAADSFTDPHLALNSFVAVV